VGLTDNGNGNGDYDMSATANPQRYASPEILMEDPNLSAEERKKRLEEWKLDLELQLNATDENMPPLNKAGDAKIGVDDNKSELLRRVTNCLRQVH
jgi:hypothetical protein